jgi:hypothetical protein
MRRTASIPYEASPADVNKSGGDAFARRAQQKRALRQQGSSQQSVSCLAWFFLACMAFFVLADMIYLYILSSESLPVSANIDTAEAVAQSTNTTIHPRSGPMSVLLEQRPPREDPALQDDRSSNDHNDKGPIFEILKQAGVDALKDLDQETIDALPTWSQVVRLFGDKARISGLERCQEFRETTDPTIRFFGIAGTFNTGTNLLSQLMINNCQITERMLVYGNQSKGMRWQVPWYVPRPARHSIIQTIASSKCALTPKLIWNIYI